MHQIQQEFAADREFYLSNAEKHARRLVAAEASITQSHELQVRVLRANPPRTHQQITRLGRREDFAHAVAKDASRRLSLCLAALSEGGMDGYAKSFARQLVRRAWRAKRKAMRRVWGEPRRPRYVN